MTLIECPYCKQMSFEIIDDTESICKDEDCGFSLESE